MKDTAYGASPAPTVSNVDVPTSIEWEAALREAEQSNLKNNGWTLIELCEALGFGSAKGRIAIKGMIKRGTMVCFPRGRQQQSIIGRMIWVPTYLLISKTKKKGTKKNARK